MPPAQEGSEGGRAVHDEGAQGHERLAELMNRYTNPQLPSAEVIAELIAMAQDIAADCERGKAFSPPLDDDQLAF